MADKCKNCSGFEGDEHMYTCYMCKCVLCETCFDSNKEIVNAHQSSYDPGWICNDCFYKNGVRGEFIIYGDEDNVFIVKQNRE